MNINSKLILKIVFLILIIGIIVIGIYALKNSYREKQPQNSASVIISRNGIHWHSELSIYINGIKQEIPKNIGIGAIHLPIHTHDENGIIHLEIQGVVKKEDTALGRFFENWKKQFNQNCIFNFCNNENKKIKMLVNGKENTEFDSYQMRDNDKIEIRFE